MHELDDLRSVAFQDTASSISTAEGLRVFLSSRPEVISLRRAIVTEAIGADELREFIRTVLLGFTPNRKFADDVSIAAVAVALETHPAAFAQEFLDVLARIVAAEVPLAPRVARLCLRERRNRLSGLTTRTSTISSPVPRMWGPPTEHHPSPISTPADDLLYRISA
jgi:hypothetical protein